MHRFMYDAGVWQQLDMAVIGITVSARKVCCYSWWKKRRMNMFACIIAIFDCFICCRLISTQEDHMSVLSVEDNSASTRSSGLTLTEWDYATQFILNNYLIIINYLDNLSLPPPFATQITRQRCYFKKSDPPLYTPINLNYILKSKWFRRREHKSYLPQSKRIRSTLYCRATRSSEW